MVPRSWWARHPCLWLSATRPFLALTTLPYTLDVPALGCDCVLDGSFHFLSNRPFSVLAPSPFRRRLRHVINPASNLRPIHVAPAPPDADTLFDRAVWLTPSTSSSPVLHWGGGLPINNPLAQVYCKSVYSSTKWTIRALSVPELCQIYEVPDYDIPTNIPPQLNPTALPFLGSAPAKVLTQAVKAWTHLSPRYTLPLTETAHTNPPSNLPTSYPAPAVMHDHSQSYTHATKADDAVIPTHFWDDRVWPKSDTPATQPPLFVVKYNHSTLDTLRSWLLRRWRRNISRSLCRYLRDTHGLGWATKEEAQRDITVGRDCLLRACSADWWEWKLGSTLFFWRWPKEMRVPARDGYPVWWLTSPPNNKRPQPPERDPVIRDKVSEKLRTVRSKGYIVPGKVLNLTSYFAVPKGDSDIRVVYDATRSGLNSCIWVPSFSLPGAEAVLDMMDTSSYMMDMDLGEMFYNFPMHESVQAYCGLDLRPYLNPTSNKTMWERWSRCMMGWVAAPYLATKYQLLADEVAQGDPQDPSNPFRWARVVMNLPGLPSYDPTQPWVYRTTRDGKKRSGGPTYVDDVRMIGTSLEDCWAVAHQFATRLSYLGIQVASRKTRPPSKTPGAWAGIVASAAEEGVTASVTIDKWLKAQLLLRDLTLELQTQPLLNHKNLERTRGFFNHLQRTYPSVTPFLKGFHLTLDGWRGGRDQDLWPEAEDSDDDALTLDPSTDPPQYVTPAPRLASDLKVLSLMFAPAHPTIRFVRATRIAVALYGFGDASGSGFGSTIQLPSSRIQIRYGMWGSDANDKSSNYRELRNLVEAVENNLQELQDSELFLFTDNSTAEGAYYRGNSPNKNLFELVVRLRLLDMTSSIRLHLTHIAGSRMIRQGTDAVSRGTIPHFTLQPDTWTSLVPLHQCAISRCPTLLPWFQSWVPAPLLQPLTPEEWFTKGHGWTTGSRNLDNVWTPTPCPDTWMLWCPPPAAAQAAINELSTSRQKRTHINHVFICPRLCTHLWRKKLFKVADIVMEIPAGARPFWPATMHEPLLLGLTLRFASVPPWQLRLSPSLLGLGQQVRQVWVDASGDERPLLQQLCHLPTSMEGLPGGVVRPVLHGPP